MGASNFHHRKRQGWVDLTSQRHLRFALRRLCRTFAEIVRSQFAESEKRVAPWRAFTRKLDCDLSLSVEGHGRDHAMVAELAHALALVATCIEDRSECAEFL